ncbi:MAG: hypothetical protein EWV91_05245 [Microcystis aeruginosa Ma_QC_Ca_00000000_S207]|uniref:Uncharacterized protein n=1 Tax=Microcystis aeruginosa Ma_QC_Ca_00000000_S207 TaxID=2486251 RepID=A0A552FXI4_MICAE|nr:MAG: hypothetical protein EWV91_05245 [Microcystis aeruginosa Ma_QC_Ca_00000000_S207]
MGKTPHPTPHTPTPNPQPPTPNPQPPPKNFLPQTLIRNCGRGLLTFFLFYRFLSHFSRTFVGRSDPITTTMTHRP